MSDIAELVSSNLDIWTSAIERKSGAGRRGGKRISLYGVERLRALILDLAVRGKLVPQDAGDEPAVELLRKINKERAASKQVGKALKTGNGTEGELSSRSETPKGWAIVRLADVILGSVGGGTPSKAEPSFWGGDIPWASVKDVGKSKFVSETQDRITELGLAKSSANLVPAGNIVLVTRMGLGQLSINTVDLAINQDLRAIFLSRHVDIDYCYNYFLTCEIEGAGMTVKGIKLDDLLGLLFPLPPLAEQQRIVAKVDELMALCDALERESADALTAHQTLVENLLATLVNSADAEDLAANWARLESHFDTLFTTEASIDALKQTILDLAVRGKLVEQNLGDEGAKKLLAELDKAANVLQRENRISKRKRIEFGKDWTPQFEIPEGWAWECFGNYAAELATGPFGTMIHQSDYVDGGVPLINPSHMIADQIVEDPTICLPESKASALATYQLLAGDIVFARRGEVGRLALVTTREEGWLCGTGSFRARFASQSVQPYLALFFRTKYARDFLGGESVGSTMSNLNHSILNRLPLPIPPLAEQHRIVAKVDELMALCDALKARITDAAITQKHLADAIVERAAA